MGNVQYNNEGSMFRILEGDGHTGLGVRHTTYYVHVKEVRGNEIKDPKKCFSYFYNTSN